MIDKNYNDPVKYYHDIIDYRSIQKEKYDRKIEKLTEIRNRPNPMSILMTYAEYIEFKKTHRNLVDVTV